MKRVNEETAAKFGFKPRRFRRHDAAAIGDGEDLVDLRGEHGNGEAHFARVDAFFEFFNAADAADEVDAFVGTRILDVEDGRQDAFLQKIDVERSDGIVSVDRSGIDREQIPLFAEIDAVGTRVFWGLEGRFFDFSDLLQLGEDLIVGAIFVIFEDAVIRHDFELIGGEKDGEEMAVRSVGGGIGGFLSAFRAGAYGASRSMMSVGDVAGVDVFESVFVCFWGCRAPDDVADSVVGHKIVEGFAFCIGSDERVDRGVIAICQKDRSGVRSGFFDVTRAVVFFVFSRELVFFDAIFDVIVDVRAGDDARLRMVAHDLAINVDLGL